MKTNHKTKGNYCSYRIENLFVADVEVDSSDYLPHL